MRHINANSLWIQERQNEKDLERRKVLGTENPADLMTNNLARQALDKSMLQLKQHRAAGRAKASLDLQGRGKTDAATVSSPGADSVAAGRVSAGPGPFNSDISVESDFSDPEMPALVPLAIPARRSACHALYYSEARRRALV